MLYNRCTGIYKFGNNTLGAEDAGRIYVTFFRGKSASYGP